MTFWKIKEENMLLPTELGGIKVMLEKKPNLKIGFHILFRVHDGIAIYYREGYILDMYVDEDHMILKIAIWAASSTHALWYDVQNISYFILSEKPDQEDSVPWVDK
jgi:hypothetical protein